MALLGAILAIAPGAGAAPSLPEVRPAGHGWMWLRSDEAAKGEFGPGGVWGASSASGSGLGTVLVHFPPRGLMTTEISAADGSGGIAGAQSGEVRLAPGFAEPPERIAWWNNRVYIVLREERMLASARGDWQRRILGVTASPETGGGTTGWSYPPGRPELVASLPGKVDLVAFGASRYGPVAVLGPARGRGSDSRLLVHAASWWHPVALPWQGEDRGLTANRRVWLPWPRSGLAIVTWEEGDEFLTIWRGELPSPIPQGRGKEGVSDKIIQVDWVSARLPLALRAGLTGDQKPPMFPSPEQVFAIDDQIVAAAWEAGTGELGRARFASLRAGEPAVEFPSLEGVPRRATLVPMDGSGRLVVVWDPPRVEKGLNKGEDAEAGGLSSLEVREVSATSGRVLYAGTMKAPPWLTSAEYRTLAIVLVMVAAAVLIFVLRRVPAKERSEPRSGEDGGG